MTKEEITYTSLIAQQVALEANTESLKEQLGLQRLSVSDTSLSAETEIASIYYNYWSKGDPEVRRSCGMSAKDMPETVTEFKAMQRRFKNDSDLLIQLAQDWKQEIDDEKERIQKIAEEAARKKAEEAERKKAKEEAARKKADAAAQSIADEANKAIKEEQDEQ